MHSVDWSRKVFETVLPFENSDLEKMIKDSSPSESIVISREEYSKLAKIAKDIGIYGATYVPIDIFKSDTIPIQDCIIEFYDDNEDSPDNTTHRVIHVDDQLILCTMIQPEIAPTQTYGYFVGQFDDHMIVDASNVYMTKEAYEGFKWGEMYKPRDVKEMIDLSLDVEATALQLWYCIQVLLLNPDLKKSDIFQRIPGKIKVQGVKETDKKGKRKAKYIKRYMLSKTLFASKKDFKRKTLCWYVIGHYRKHGDGKTWVKGYWKGPMRHAKQNLDEGRIREI